MQTPNDGNQNGGSGNEHLNSWWGFLGEEEQVTVALRRVEKGSEPFLERFTISPKTVPTVEDMEEAVKERHGGGIYMVVFPGEGGRFAGRVKLEIAGLPKKQESEEARPQGQLSELAMLMQRSDERFAQVMGEIRELRQAPAVAPVDPLEQVERVANILNRTGGAPQPQKGLLEQITELKQVTDLLGLGNGGGDNAGMNWLDLAEKFGPMVLSLAGQGGGTVAEANGQQALPAPAANQQAAVIQKLRLLLLSMVELADLEVEPRRALQKVQQRAGDYWPMLQEVIGREDAIESAEQLVPEVAEHREWFAAVRAAVLGQDEPEKQTTKAAPKARATSKRKAA
ncbi:MAG: hypothetical protein K0S46_2212 [Moraxellaceae bacterium]|jgi:hypothetical protein|nr:hypothetical protein [Moraxellaceae bacterium]